MSKLKGFRKSAISQWPLTHLHPDPIIVSDALACFNTAAEAGREHDAIVTGGAPTA
jgi:hypothetical protein